MAQVLARRPAQRRDNLLDAGIWDGGEDDGQEVADTHAGGKAAAERFIRGANADPTTPGTTTARARTTARVRASFRGKTYASFDHLEWCRGRACDKNRTIAFTGHRAVPDFLRFFFLPFHAICSHFLVGALDPPEPFVQPGDAPPASL